MALVVTDSLSTILRLLGEESAAASWLIQARSRIDPVELCNEEWQPRSHNVIYVICVICIIYGTEYIEHTYLIYKRGFLRSTVVYLKDLSPYCRQFSPYSKSQNTIRVNLLGNHSTSYYYVINFLFTYTPSPLIESTVVLAIRFRYTFTTWLQY